MNEVQRPQGFISAPPQAVLMLCIHNSARSQMAEGFARSLAPSDVSIWSAGTKPSQVHPLAFQVMSEIGIDITGQRSKPLDDVPWRDADTVVTLCAEAEVECPVLPGAVRRVHWPLPDPSVAPEADQLRVFREIRDEIRWRVAALWPRES